MFGNELQPDQQPDRWNDHVDVYERVFEPLTNAFAAHALKLLQLRDGERLIDVAAGSGGAALMAAEQGADVLAVDASPQMTARIAARAHAHGPLRGSLQAATMDGMALTVADASFDAAISIFGVILFPDAEGGIREIGRVLKPGGRLAVVTWTEPERYELAARLLAAIASVLGPQPPPPTLPAQLRFRDEAAFRELLGSASLRVDAVARIEERWRLPSARWIAERIAFAPGMRVMIDRLGADRKPVLERFVADLERDHGRGEIGLSAVAHAAVAVRPP